MYGALLYAIFWKIFAIRLVYNPVDEQLQFIESLSAAAARPWELRCDRGRDSREFMSQPWIAVHEDAPPRIGARLEQSQTGRRLRYSRQN